MDTFPFLLAEHLHKSLEEIEDLSTREHFAWQAFFTWRKAMSDLRND